MVQAGAHGQTAEQIARVLHLPADSASAQRALGLLHRRVAPGEAGPRGVKLSSANSLWFAKELGVLPEYLAMIHEEYRSTANEAPFERDPDSARRAINAWVKSQTDGKILEFLKPGAIDRTTQLVLINALTFQGSWATAFKKERTRPGPFRVGPERQVEVPLMQQTGRFRVAATAAGEALGLPYTGRDVALMVLLPRNPDGLAELEKQLTGPFVSAWLGQLKPEMVAVSLPRFTITAESDSGICWSSSAWPCHSSETGPTSDVSARPATPSRLAASPSMSASWLTRREPKPTPPPRFAPAVAWVIRPYASSRLIVPLCSCSRSADRQHPVPRPASRPGTWHARSKVNLSMISLRLHAFVTPRISGARLRGDRC